MEKSETPPGSSCFYKYFSKQVLLCSFPFEDLVLSLLLNMWSQKTVVFLPNSEIDQPELTRQQNSKVEFKFPTK